MILNQRAQRMLSTPSRLVLGLGIAAALMIFPTWGGSGLEEPEEAGARDADEREIRELEREQVTLERQLQQLHARRMDVEHELAERQFRLEIERIRAEADALEAAGETEAVREIRERIERHQRAKALQTEAMELERRRIDVAIELEYELRSLQLEAEELRARGDALAARDAAERAQELERKLGRIHAEDAVRERQLRIEMVQSEIAEVERERERLGQAWEIDAAEAYELELEQALREAERREKEDR